MYNSQFLSAHVIRVLHLCTTFVICQLYGHPKRVNSSDKGKLWDKSQPTNGQATVDFHWSTLSCISVHAILHVLYIKIIYFTSWYIKYHISSYFNDFLVSCAVISIGPAPAATLPTLWNPPGWSPCSSSSDPSIEERLATSRFLAWSTQSQVKVGSFKGRLES